MVDGGSDEAIRRHHGDLRREPAGHRLFDTPRGVPARRRGAEDLRHHVTAARLQPRRDVGCRRSSRRVLSALRGRRSGAISCRRERGSGHQVSIPARRAGPDPHHRRARRDARRRSADGRHHRQVSRIRRYARVRHARLHHHQQRRRHARHQPGYLRHAIGRHLCDHPRRLPRGRGAVRQAQTARGPGDPVVGSAAGGSEAALGARGGARYRCRRARLHRRRAHRRRLCRRILSRR